MLKYKFRVFNTGDDIQSLDILDVEQFDLSRYHIDPFAKDVEMDEDYSIVRFKVSDLYDIESGRELLAMNDVMVCNPENEIGQETQYNYTEYINVQSVSKPDRTLTIHKPKLRLIDTNSMSIETRFNIIRFVENRWIKETSNIYSVSKMYPDAILWNESENFKNIDIREVALVGKSDDYVILYTYDEDGTQHTQLASNYIVYYYENNEWKEMSFVNDDMEGCYDKTSGTLNFSSFNKYDKTTRKVYWLDTEKVYYTQEDYVTFICLPTHYLTTPIINAELDEDVEESLSETPKYSEYGKTIVNSIDYPIIHFKTNYIVDGNRWVDVECHIDSDTRFSYNLDILSKEYKVFFINQIFNNDIDYETEYIGEKTITYIEETDGNVGLLDAYVNNIMYDRDYVAFDLGVDKITNTIQIPLTQKFETDLYHNDAVEENFVKAIKDKAINPIIDMEKDVYTPAIQNYAFGKDGTANQVNATYTDCYKIVFNLHFREHRGEEWRCENESYWNGTRVLTYTINEKEYKVLDLDGRIYNYAKDCDDDQIENGEVPNVKEKRDYFSYYGKNPDEDETGYDTADDYDMEKLNYWEKRDKRNSMKEFQSDLLSYVGFTDNDIKYQKTKLKKSFLRISFYDSDNIANQNLLHTATIFLDSGNYFAKYVRWHDMPYGEWTARTGGSNIKGHPNTEYFLDGVRVDREPMRDNPTNFSWLNLGTQLGEWEDLRLSTQIVVEDKYSSKRSSEGFYFYTYKGNSDGVFPSDIYMKVEFNHAGYGRVIPFMMPYIRESEINNPRYSINGEKIRNDRIKTFDDICYDWSEIDDAGNPKDESEVGYGTLRYLKYSYIKWKYRYDKKTEKHIYYLDPELYGTSVTTENWNDNSKYYGTNIILNLYEGKIR